MPRPFPSRFAALGAALSAILALGQFRLILLMLDTDFARSMEAAQGVVAGTPHWRVFQSRVLAPYAIQAMGGMLGSYGAAYKAFCLGALVAAGFLAWTLGRRVGGTLRSAGLALLVFHVGFAFLLSRPWLYAWDFVGAILFLLFIHAVVAQKGWPWFTALCAVAAFNRESAYFIALWMLLDPVVRQLLASRDATVRAPLNRGMMAAGAACLVGSAVVVEWLRRALLVREVGPELFARVPGQTGGYAHFQLRDNLAVIREQFGYQSPLLLFVCIIGALSIALARRDPRRYAALGVVHLVVLGSLLVFGVVQESRIYIELLPMLVLGVVTLAAEEDARMGAEQARAVAAATGRS